MLYTSLLIAQIQVLNVADLFRKIGLQVAELCR